ncbi:MAG: hypothetical protein F6K17_39165 [Okeania sp. SIO3C4]|nr:hypothetical protein [Okeania sp. SIO3C4]
MTIQYYNGSACKVEEVFGWGRCTVELGLHEKRTGIICLGRQKTRCSNKPWEEKHPEAAAFLFELAEAHCRQDPGFQSTRLYPRLTAAKTLKQLRNYGFA